MPYRPLCLAVLVLVLAVPAARAGGITFSGGVGTASVRDTQKQFQFSGRFKSLLLTHRDGHTRYVPLAAPLSLGQGLPVPAGDWVEVLVIFDGPVSLVSPDGHSTPLPLRALAVTIDEPDAAQDRTLDVDLPSDLASLGLDRLTPEALTAAIQDGVLAVNQR